MTDEIPAPEGAAAAATPQGEVIETSATQIPGDAPATPEVKPKGVQKRIDELTANWRTTERDRDHWRELALQKAQAPQVEAAPPAGEPTLEQFEYDQAKYTKAFVAWELKNAREADAKAQKEKAATEAKTKRYQTFSERNEVFAKGKDDLRSLAEISNDRSLPFTDAMAEATLDAEDGPALLHHLDQNREEAARIAQMSPYQAALALGRIVAKLTAPAPVVQETTISAAPPPTPTVKATSSGEKEPSKMSDKEFADWRHKQIAARGR